MSIKEDLDSVVSKWSLLKYPFYQAWSAGTLPLEDLRTYAREYGTFIGLLPDAWTALNDADTAQEEGEHTELWADFAAALGSDATGAAQVSEVSDLAATASRLFKDPVTAAGALYGFEVQQPQTASSKLHGLKTHYELPADVEPYFEIHSRNEHEAAKLLARIESLSEDERTRSLQACGEMTESLWNALSGIFGEERMRDC
jgi:pyrroloquinoline-quinone synthase